MMTDKELNKWGDDFARFTEKNIKEFRGAALELERHLYDDFLSLISSLVYVDGILSDENDVAAIIAKIDEMFNRWATSETYTNGVKQYLQSFPDVRKRVLNMQEKLNDLSYTPQLYNELSVTEKFLTDKTNYDLSQGMLKRYFVEDAKQITLEAVYYGFSQQELSKRYRDRLLTQPDKDSYYMRYATQLTRDASYTLQGQFQTVIANEYQLDCIRYIGSLVDDSRPICEHIVKELKRTIKQSELPALLKRFQGTSGMKPDTDVNNFLAVRGGYGCRQIAVATRCK